MGATGFNRARRMAAEQSGTPVEQLSYEEAIAILNQPSAEAEPKSATNDESVADLESEPTEVQLTREQREAELKAANWEALRDLLKSYELPSNKPKGVSWDEFAIPQILEHEGF